MRSYKKLDLDEIAKKLKHYLGSFKEKAQQTTKKAGKMVKNLKSKVKKMPRVASLAVVVLFVVAVIGPIAYYSGIINTTVQEETPPTIPSVIPENPDVIGSPSYPGNMQDENLLNFEIDTIFYGGVSVNGLTDDNEVEISLILPAQGRVIREFGFNYSRTFGDYRFHDGIDIEVSQGASVVAVAAGEVVQVAHNEILGYTITIKHGPSLQTHYRHLTEIFVANGDSVRQGQEIGRVTEADIYLHFGITYKGSCEDPQRHLAMNN